MTDFSPVVFSGVLTSGPSERLQNDKSIQTAACFAAKLNNNLAWQKKMLLKE